METLIKEYWEAAAPVREFVGEHSLKLLALALLVALLVLVVRYRRSRRPIVLFRSQGGNVEMARSTLRGLIIGATLRVRGIEAATCRYDQKGRKLRITVSIHLAGDARLTEVEEQLKQRIRTTLQQQVGYEPADVAPIHVRVTKIIGDPLSVSPEPALLTEASAEEGYEHYDYGSDPIEEEKSPER